MESERGCGWRVVGGVYLVGSGGSAACDGLPLALDPCPCCDFTVPNSRSMVPVHAGYLHGRLKDHDCKDDFPCPFCYYGEPFARDREVDLANPDKTPKAPKKIFVMWVSKKLYTPESFMAEARNFGISKRIAPNSLPKDFKLGETWLLMAHGEVPFRGDLNGDSGDLEAEPVTKRAIFYAFKPEALELVLWKDTPADVIMDYEQAGYRVVLIEKTTENLTRHSETKLPPLPYGFKRKKSKTKRKGGE